MSIEELDLSSSGIEFHGPGPATATVLSPQVFSLAFGVARRCWKEDLSVRSERKSLFGRRRLRFLSVINVAIWLGMRRF